MFLGKTHSDESFLVFYLIVIHLSGFSALLPKSMNSNEQSIPYSMEYILKINLKYTLKIIHSKLRNNTFSNMEIFLIKKIKGM